MYDGVAVYLIEVGEDSGFQFGLGRDANVSEH